MVCWEIVLSKGQEWEWLSDPFYRVHTLLVLFVLGLVTLVWRELRIPNPLRARLKSLVILPTYAP